MLSTNSSTQMPRNETYNLGKTYFKYLNMEFINSIWNFDVLQKELNYLSTTIPFLKQMTAGNTRIFNFSTKNLALSTFILPNFTSKYFSAKIYIKTNTKSFKKNRLRSSIRYSMVCFVNFRKLHTVYQIEQVGSSSVIWNA